MGNVLLRAISTADIQSVRQLLKEDDVQQALLKPITNDEVTALMLASWRGYNEIVLALLGSQTEQQLLAKNTDGAIALIMAVENGQNEIVKTLIKAGYAKQQLLACQCQGFSPLMIASMFGHKKIVEVLLNTAYAETQIQLRSESGATALILAAKHGHDEIIEILLQVGDPLMQLTATAYLPYPGLTPLMLASMNGHETAVKKLLQAGYAKEQVDATLDGGTNALKFAHSKGHKAIVNMLQAVSGEVLPVKNNVKKSALITASGNGRLASVLSILSKGNVENKLMEKNERGTTALMMAVSEGHRDIVTSLLDAGCPDEQLSAKEDETGLTALMMAANDCFTEIVELLLCKGDTKKQLMEKAAGGEETALMFASAFGSKKIVEVLLGAGCQIEQVNAKSKTGLTVLMMASEKGRVAALKLLLQVSDTEAHKMAANETGAIALMLASKSGHKKVVELLLKANPKPQLTWTDKRGWNCLMHAAENCHAGVVKTLLKWGYAQEQLEAKDTFTDISALELCAARNIRINANYKVRPSLVLPEPLAPQQ